VSLPETLWAPGVTTRGFFIDVPILSEKFHLRQTRKFWYAPSLINLNKLKGGYMSQYIQGDLFIQEAEKLIAKLTEEKDRKKNSKIRLALHILKDLAKNEKPPQ
jgi:hypothetical protein